MNIEISDNFFNSEELRNTPERYKRFLEEWLIDDNEFEFTLFDNPDYNEMIIVKDVVISSLCSHHLLPFYGKAHVGYIPNKKLCGLSKIPRTIDKFSHRPQIQEKLTIEIKDYLVKNLDPLWLMVIIEAEHLCMSIRGVKKPGCKTITNAIYPDPKENHQFDSAKHEFLEMIRNKKDV